MTRPSRPILFAPALAMLLLCQPMSGRAADCAARRQLSAELEHIADIAVGERARLQGSAHASSVTFDGKVRPVPRLTPIEYKRAFVRTQLPGYLWSEPKALYFTLGSRAYPATDPEVIEIDPAAYLCLAAKGDLVLLSDGITDHYTNVASVDPAHGEIVFVDRWPDVLLELGDRPEALAGPYGSRTAGATLVRFGREDFAARFRAALLVDTPAFAPVLEAALGPSWNPEAQAALGRTLLYAGPHASYAVEAADALNSSLRGGAAAGDETLVADTVPTAFVANLLANLMLRAAGQPEKAGTALQYAADLEANFGPYERQPVRAEDSLLIGLAARPVSPETALYFLNDAALRDPADYRPRLGRVRIVYLQLLEATLQPNPAEAAEVSEVVASLRADVEAAVRLMDADERAMDARQAALAENRGDYWEQGETRILEDGALRREIDAGRAEAADLLRALAIVATDTNLAPDPIRP